MYAPAAAVSPAGLCLKAGTKLIPFHTVEDVDLSRLELDGSVQINTAAKAYVAYGADAVEIVMQLKPSAAEGLRLRWPRHAWALHNLLGHPLMQLLAFCRLGRWAVRLHDATTPAPRLPQ